MQRPSYSSSQAHAARDQVVVRRSLNGRQHAKFAFGDEVNEFRNRRFEVSLVFVIMSVGIGRLIAERCSGASCCHCNRVCDDSRLGEYKIILVLWGDIYRYSVSMIILYIPY